MQLLLTESALVRSLPYLRVTDFRRLFGDSFRDASIVSAWLVP